MTSHAPTPPAVQPLPRPTSSPCAPLTPPGSARWRSVMRSGPLRPERRPRRAAAPDGDAMIPVLTHAGMTPPVALLVYRPESPRESVYYPFAEFSPEWYGAQVRASTTASLPGSSTCPSPTQLGTEVGGGCRRAAAPDGGRRTGRAGSVDPLGVLARAAGFDDGEHGGGSSSSRGVATASISSPRSSKRWPRSAPPPAEDDLRERLQGSGPHARRSGKRRAKAIARSPSSAAPGTRLAL